MIKINLLPESGRKTEFPTWKIYRVATYAILGLTILLWGYHLAMFKYTENKIDDVNKNIASMKVWQERYDKAQLQSADINKRNNIVRGLAQNRIVWGRSLGELGNITPAGCWLTSVKQGSQPDQMLISGNALKMDDVLGFISALQTRPGIAGVRLQKASESQNNKITVTDFTLEVQRSGVKK